MIELEHYFQCPYCWQKTSILLDLTIEEQTYIEDCEVCCQPIAIYYSTRDEELVEFNAWRNE